VSPCPLMSGSVISARPVGVLQMTDESGPEYGLIVSFFRPNEALEFEGRNRFADEGGGDFFWIATETKVKEAGQGEEDG